ncbi:MAG: sulfatase-like hydrolase/transferase [Candidatus Hydrogenedens sp.]|nr:sulfatase-like hydrolase/transferase [Candidatus Hydrogenedens sp.]
MRRLACALVALCGLAAQAETPPNIIYIMADDLGYGDLGCYGQNTIKTPYIDAMASEGMRFTQAYAGSTVCAPSRCALMTGKHTGQAYVRGNVLVPLADSEVTVAEVLKTRGYDTALIGKWGIAEPGTEGVPNKQGFDYFFGYLNQMHAHNYYPDYLWRNEEKVTLDNVDPGDGVSTVTKTYSHDLFAQEALDYVAREHDKPFFLYLALTLPHANNERGGKEGNGMEVPDLAPYEDNDWPAPQKGHAAMITRLDRDVGRLMQALKDHGLDENTIVFFTSDNGPHAEGGAKPEFFRSAGDLNGKKRDLTDGGIKVPMIVRWPGHVEAGSESDLVWAFWDFLPTAAALADAEPPKDINGISVLPTLLGQEGQQQHDYLYWEFFEGGFLQGVRMKNWKGIRRDFRRFELYDLNADPGEKTNVADEHPEVVNQIAGIMDQARTDSEHFPIPEKALRNKK